MDHPQSFSARPRLPPLLTASLFFVHDMLGKDRPASPLPLYARSQTSCGIKSAVHLVALFLLFLLTICTYLRTSYTTPKPHPSRRTPGYEGPPLLDCPALSPEEASLDAALRALETEEPMWTRKIFQSDKRADRTGARRSWLELNPSHRFEVCFALMPRHGSADDGISYFSTGKRKLS